MRLGFIGTAAFESFLAIVFGANLWWVRREWLHLVVFPLSRRGWAGQALQGLGRISSCCAALSSPLEPVWVSRWSRAFVRSLGIVLLITESLIHAGGGW